MSRADSIKILYQELKTGILSLTDIQEQVDMNKKQVLDLHKKMYNYWQGVGRRIEGDINGKLFFQPFSH